MAAPLAFSNKSRLDYVNTLKSTEFDLVVIGGGITEAGIALDASSRGLKVALLEKGDFASGNQIHLFTVVYAI